MHGKKFSGLTKLQNRLGIREHARAILESDNHSFAYKSGKLTTLVTTRFVPELNWYLVIEQQEEIQPEIVNSLVINLLFSFFVAAGLMLFAHRTVGKYQQQLEVLASTDNLTGADNRYAFEIKISRAIQQANDSESTLSLLLIDLDHFKSINDQFGHIAGDEVLKQSAEFLKEHLPPTASICRWGGEEFLVCLPQTNINRTEHFATELISRFQTNEFVVANDVISLTISCGISELKQNESEDELFKRADKALYQAKASGRNRLVIG